MTIPADGTPFDLFPPKGAGQLRRNWRVGLRLIFGLFWTADAYLKWSLIVQGIDYGNLISSATEGQPGPIVSWISFWGNLAKATPNFPYIMALIETAIAVFLLIGFLTKLTSLVGIIFSFLIWSTAEAFGGIFTRDATDIGTSPLYMAMFAGLIVVQAGRQHGMDKWVARKYPRLTFLL